MCYKHPNLGQYQCGLCKVFDVFFFVVSFLKWGETIQANITISGPSSVRQRNAIKWRFAGVPTMAQH